MKNWLVGLVCFTALPAYSMVCQTADAQKTLTVQFPGFASGDFVLAGADSAQLASFQVDSLQVIATRAGSVYSISTQDGSQLVFTQTVSISGCRSRAGCYRTEKTAVSLTSAADASVTSFSCH